MDRRFQIQTRLQELRGLIQESAERYQVKQLPRLIAVTKHHGLDEIAALIDAGQYEIGENRVQEFIPKYEELKARPEDLKFHLIGHLQRNKVRMIVDKVDLIHSLDSLRLAETLNSEAAAVGQRLPVLLQFNISHEEQKHGFELDEYQEILEELAEFDNLDLRGLMGMAAFDADHDELLRTFSRLRDLYESIRAHCKSYLRRGGEGFSELSMGMSRDFREAIACGATILRIGSSLFE
ncbi:MAG: YggS family pyridoxal phosphate-dependent enzyme [Eubacteriales bacterium]|nr:YggS family pyridoxal phosphate-dependent enzyme [Eubacteriales bacterium]